MKSRFQHGSVRYLRIARALRSQFLFWRGWTYPRRRKTSSSLPPRSDVETYYLTRTSAVNTHYPAASSKNDVLSRCSIDTRVFEKWILNTPDPRRPSFINVYHAWARRRARRIHERSPGCENQPHCLCIYSYQRGLRGSDRSCKRLTVEATNRTSPISRYSYASWPRLFT